MKKAYEYLEHARECRALAKQSITDDQRKQLIAMADTWERLADERETNPRSLSLSESPLPE